MPRLIGLGWVRPTLRLIPWWGLALPVGATALFGSLVRLATGGMPAEFGVAALAATAAAVPQVLEDPAYRLLSPVPPSRRRRLGYRLVLFLPVLLVAWALVAPVVIDRQHAAVVSVGPLLALATIGLAGGCLVGRVLPEAAPPVGTVIPLGIAGPPLVFADAVAHADIWDVWIDHPWATVVVAALVCVVSLGEAPPGRGQCRPRTDSPPVTVGPIDPAELTSPPPTRRRADAACEGKTRRDG
jgi:hypothetical protein